MKPVELSKRLKCIAEMVTPGCSVMDVGCDHGFLSIFLVENGIALSAKAMDVREGPLNAAKTHVREHGLEEKIECILSDGLHKAPYPEPNTSLVIAGMGGPLIIRILSECPEIRDAFDELILSPQSQIEEFRVELRNLGIKIIDEKMIFEDGKYYTCVKCIPNGKLSDSEISINVLTENWEALSDKYGAYLLAKKDKVLLQFLEYENGLLREVISHLNPEQHSDRYAEVLEDIEKNKQAIDLVTDTR